MTTAHTISCDICMYNFNQADRKSVALPCSHNFCLTCLVCLKTSGSDKCPKCRGDWAELEVEALPGMEDANCDHLEKKGFPVKTREKGDDLCKKHELTYIFWSKENKDFLCKKCVVENRCNKLELIDDAIPQIKTDLSERVAVAAYKIEKDFHELDMMNAELNDKLRLVQEFKKEVEKLEREIGDCIKRIKHLKATNLNASVIREEVEERIQKINSDLDIFTILDSRSTLAHISEPFERHYQEESKTLLCNIACSYMEASGADRSPSKHTFVCELLNTSERRTEPDDPLSLDALMSLLLRAPAVSTELITSVGRSVEELKEREVWAVDSSNCLAALLALADRQPDALHLIAKPNESLALPAAASAAVVKAARGCWFKVNFLYSFLNPQDVNKETETLEHIIGNSSLRFIEFLGHLDPAGIAKLPHTIRWLGLAISSAAEARAVSDLRPWERLRVLQVSVSCGIAAHDLRPLPSGPVLRLHFFGLTDAWVDNVRPAIDALVPHSGFSWLCLPACQLTAGGLTLLTLRLRGIEFNAIIVEMSGSWQPKEEEMMNFEAEFRSVLDCNVSWSLDMLNW